MKKCERRHVNSQPLPGDSDSKKQSMKKNQNFIQHPGGRFKKSARAFKGSTFGLKTGSRTHRHPSERMVRSLNGQGAAVRQGSRWREKRQDSLTVRAFDVGPAPALSAPSAPSAVPSDGFTYGGGGRGRALPPALSDHGPHLRLVWGQSPKVIASPWQRRKEVGPRPSGSWPGLDGTSTRGCNFGRRN